MKNARRILTVLLLAILLLSLFSCAPASDLPEDDTTEATEPADTTAADTEPADSEAVKPDPPVGGHEKMVFPDSFLRLEFTASNGEELPYCLYVPENYSEDYAYPLLLMFHGAGTRGDDNGSQLTEGVLGFFMPKNTPAYDCIAVFPLCDSESRWVETDWSLGSYSLDEVEISRNMTAVVELLDYLTETYSINENRQYVTGFSMGGYGTWDLLARFPDRFAAAIPICGGGDPSKAAELTDIPIHVFHDAGDGSVPVEASREMVDAILAAGGEKIIYTETEGNGHEVWDAAIYEGNLSVIYWMFEQRRGQ